MLEQYRRILERRRSQIMEQIRWTKEISMSFCRGGLLTKDEIQDIEMDLNSKNRMFAALNKLMNHSEPGTFEKFRQLLVDCGHNIMAESLDFDRSRIHWGFEKRQLATSLSNYIDHLNADLLQASTAQSDEHIRQCMVIEAKRRMTDLRNTVRQVQLDRDNYRQEMWQLLTGETERACRSPVLADPVTLSQLEDEESSRDERLVKEACQVLSGLRRTVRELREDNRMLRQMVDSRSDAETVASTVEPCVAAQRPTVDCEDPSEDKDLEADHDLTDSAEHTLHFSKTTFHQLLKSLKSFIASSHTDSQPTLTEELTGDQLNETLQLTAVELERWRNRCQLFGINVQQFERERELIAHELGLSTVIASDQSFIQCALHKIDEIRVRAASVQLQPDLRGLVENGIKVEAESNVGRVFERRISLSPIENGGTIDKRNSANKMMRKISEGSLPQSVHGKFKTRINSSPKLLYVDSHGKEIKKRD